MTALACCCNHDQLGTAARPQDADVPLSRFIPPLLGLSQRRAQELAGGMFIPVDVAQDKQYLLSVKHGRVLEPRLLMRLLRGQFHEAERDEDP